MSEVKNALFIMCDQLRWDYLQHAGHPHIRTPALDAFTRRATRFSQCYVQAPVCGGSRMSFYTGRYAYSHGAHYNNFPLRIDERGLGDYLSEVGVHTSLIGKTHMKADDAALERLGVDPGSDIGRRVRQVGFDAIERDDGLHPEVTLRANLPYNAYLRSHGYLGRNPWHEYANSAAGPNGEILSGWHMRHANRPARVHRDHSETAYMTDRALDFLSVDRAEPWCLHLSYIKPHWPYIAPEPYHRMYGPDEVLRANRTAAERAAPHPVVHAFMQHDESVSFASQECRETVIPTYMGLISEIDDHFARLIAHLEDSGRLDDTMVIFTSDHGDYLGDHWLGEKDLFHDEVVRVPMIIYDPSRAADATRGETIEQFVEAIDIVPTLLEALGGEPARTSLDGRSLLPLMRGS
ncbi:MAG: sulfatase-like hydrolase/transferase, partial [Gammaproteobacteria bacterium]|nr:sulfatase-like hydrolase/transferase [Gammaproteobacteria bacterium]